MKETISKDLGVKKLSEIEDKKIEWLVPEYILFSQPLLFCLFL